MEEPSYPQAVQTNCVETPTMSHRQVTTFLLLLAIMGMANCATARAEQPPLKITTKRDSDQVEIKTKQGRTDVSIRSPRGISQAIIRRTRNQWPDEITLQLHLSGLEHFKVSDGKMSLEAAISSQDGRVRLWRNGQEDSPLDAKHPYWMEIRMIGKHGKPVNTIPLKDGYFEMRLPQAVLKDNPKTITMNWIDFYR